MAKKKKMMFMADTIMEKMTDFSLPVPQTERPIIKVFRNLWYSIVDYRVPKMFFLKISLKYSAWSAWEKSPFYVLKPDDSA